METNCILDNDCANKNLCCHFCSKTDCAEKCIDDVSKCRFFDGDVEALSTVSSPKKKRAPRQKTEKTTEVAQSTTAKDHKSLRQNTTNYSSSKKTVELW